MTCAKRNRIIFGLIKCPLFQSGAFIDARHLFEGRGVIETTITDQVMERSVETKLNEICTDDAIECGAEEVEIVSEVAGSVNVSSRIALEVPPG